MLPTSFVCLYNSVDFVVNPSCTSPRDPNSIPGPHNAELSPFWKIG